MLQVVKDELNLRRKLMILEFVHITGNVRKTCREFDVPSPSFLGKHIISGLKELPGISIDIMA